ncbi:MAG: hypothetical protein ACFE85_15515 [Candidatus Hodarchaeota archaeon]
MNKTQIINFLMILSILTISWMVPIKLINIKDKNYNQIDNLSVNLSSEIEIPIFGYKFTVELENPIERDDNARLRIVKYNKVSLDLEIQTKFGIFYYDKLMFEEEILDSSQEITLRRFEIESPCKGFFMELLIGDNFTYINLAFEGKECQLSYDGFLSINLIELLSNENKIYLIQDSGELFIIKSMIQQIKQKQDKELFIYKSENFLQKYSEAPKISGISYTAYGIAHDLWDLDEHHDIDNPSYLRQLPDDYWEAYSDIDIGIWRFMPSESQVKSDLQYYNKDYYDGLMSGEIKDILAYNVLTEDKIYQGKTSGPEWEVYQWQKFWWWWFQNIVGIIWPYEIEDLWYHSYNPYTGEEIDVYPENSLIFAHTCYGWSAGLGDYRGPEMAHAFYDFGASAFVGSHEPTYAWCEGDLPDPARIEFWDSLCQQNENLGTALDDYCAFLSWVFGYNVRSEWHIMGNSLLTI